jgi:hypothetical protein
MEVEDGKVKQAKVVVMAQGKEASLDNGKSLDSSYGHVGIHCACFSHTTSLLLG